MATRRPDQVAAIILAAGTSSRLGRPKQLLEIGGQPVILQVARKICDSIADRVLLVTGAHAGSVEAAVGHLRLQIVHNPDFEDGQATSFRAGLLAAQDEADAIVVLLGDQPQIQTSTVNQVIDTWLKTRALIVQASYRGMRSHPVLFDRALFSDLGTVEGDSGAANVIRNRGNEVVLVDIDEDVPIDIDTDDDYRQILRLMAQEK